VPTAQDLYLTLKKFALEAEHPATSVGLPVGLREGVSLVILDSPSAVWFAERNYETYMLFQYYQSLAECLRTIMMKANVALITTQRVLFPKQIEQMNASLEYNDCCGSAWKQMVSYRASCVLDASSSSSPSSSEERSDEFVCRIMEVATKHFVDKRYTIAAHGTKEFREFSISDAQQH
jgi:hypothetical protein